MEVEFLAIGFIVSFGGEMFLLSDVIISFVLLYYLLRKLSFVPEIIAWS